MKIICWIHKIKFESYCKNCNKLFCPKCKNINRHVLINLTNQSESAELFIKSFGRLNWLLSLKDNGLFNFENEKRTCINKLDRKDLIKKEKAYIIKKIEEKEGKFDASLFKIYSTLNSVKIKNCLYKFEIFETGEEIFDPNTKESLGTLDTIKETIEAINVLPKMCICRHLTTSIYNMVGILNSNIYKTKIKTLNVDATQISGGLSSDKKIRIGDEVRLITE